MSYKINDRRITKMSRPELLRRLEETHSSIPAEVFAGYHNGYANGVAELDLVTAQRDQAVAELDVLTADRDHYKKEYVNNSLKLMTSETELSKAEARVAVLMAECLNRWEHRWVVGISLTLLVLGLTLCAGVAVWLA